MTLRRDIIEGQLAPGEKLRVEHLKDDYGVGAGTLREALSLLISDALVVSQGQRGFRVAPVSLEDLRRHHPHPRHARVRSAADSRLPWVTMIGKAPCWQPFHRLVQSRGKTALVRDGPCEEWEERNRIFHEVLISACPSRWIKHFLAILYHQAERYRRLSLYLQPIPRDVHAEHEALLQSHAWRAIPKKPLRS